MNKFMPALLLGLVMIPIAFANPGWAGIEIDCEATPESMSCEQQKAEKEKAEKEKAEKEKAEKEKAEKEKAEKEKAEKEKDDDPVSIPEPGATTGILALGALGAGYALRKKLSQQ